LKQKREIWGFLVFVVAVLSVVRFSPFHKNFNNYNVKNDVSIKLSFVLLVVFASTSLQPTQGADAKTQPPAKPAGRR
jgi:hypothetical protein